MTKVFVCTTTVRKTRHTVSFHDSGIATPFGLPDDVNNFPGLEKGTCGDSISYFVLIDVVRAKLAQDRKRFSIGLLAMTNKRLRCSPQFAGAKPELDGCVPVPFRSLLLHHGTRSDLNNRDRNERPVGSKDLRHAKFFSNQTDHTKASLLKLDFDID